MAKRKRNKVKARLGHLVHRPDASSPRLELPKRPSKLEHFSEIEESFFRAGHELSNAAEAAESFADLDAESPPRLSFWQRLFASY